MWDAGLKAGSTFIASLLWSNKNYSYAILVGDAEAGKGGERLSDGRVGFQQNSLRLRGSLNTTGAESLRWSP